VRDLRTGTGKVPGHRKLWRRSRSTRGTGRAGKTAWPQRANRVGMARWSAASQTPPTVWAVRQQPPAADRLRREPQPAGHAPYILVRPQRDRDIMYYHN
jgi:hypothetical protein